MIWKTHLRGGVSHALFSQFKSDRFFKDTLPRPLLLLAFGLVLTINPWMSTRVVMGIAAAALALYGALMAFRYFRLGVDAGAGMLSRGLIAIAAALVLWATPLLLIDLLPTLIGFALIACGIGELERAVSLKRTKTARWYVALIFALAVIALGAIIVMNPFYTLLSLIRFIGIAMLATAVLELACAFLFSRSKAKTTTRA